MIGYIYIFLYYFFTNTISNQCKKNNIIISKQLQKQYNITVSVLSFFLTVNAYKILSTNTFHDIACHNSIDTDIDNDRHLFFP